MSLRTSLGLAIAIFGILSPSLRAQDSEWVLTNIQVVDLERGRVLPRLALTIRGDRIVRIGAAEDVGNTSARRIDGHGSFVIPGLYDMHVHLGMSGVISDTALTHLVEQGVLGVRDMGFPIDSLSVLANIARTGRGQAAEAPRIWFVGPILNAPSTTKFPQHVEVADEAAIKSIVPRIAAGGGMAVKIHDRLSAEAYRQVAMASRAQGLPVVGHIPVAVSMDEVINERQSTVEHLGGLTHPMLMACSRDPTSHERATAAVVPDDFFRLYRVTMSAAHLAPLLDGFDARKCAALAQRLRAAGSWQVPTLVLWKLWATTVPDASDMPSTADIAARRRLYTTMLEITDILFREHVPLMAGTDNIASIPEELATLVEAGLQPIDALRSATVQPARFLKTPLSGLVKSGYAADLVLLRGNPLQDVSNTGRIAGVVMRGRYVAVEAANSNAR